MTRTLHVSLPANWGVAAMIAFAAVANAAEESRKPPRVGLQVPPPFSTSVSVKRYRAGEDILNSPPYRLITTAAMTEYHGWFGPRTAKQSSIHGWTVQVYATFSDKVASACVVGKDGAETALPEGPGLIKPVEPRYMAARVRSKRFRWGNAVSFLSQGTQDRRCMRRTTVTWIMRSGA